MNVLSVCCFENAATRLGFFWHFLSWQGCRNEITGVSLRQPCQKKTEMSCNIPVVFCNDLLVCLNDHSNHNKNMLRVLYLETFSVLKSENILCGEKFNEETEKKTSTRIMLSTRSAFVFDGYVFSFFLSPSSFFRSKM